MALADGFMVLLEFPSLYWMMKSLILRLKKKHLMAQFRYRRTFLKKSEFDEIQLMAITYAMGDGISVFYL